MKLLVLALLLKSLPIDEPLYDHVPSRFFETSTPSTKLSHRMFSKDRRRLLFFAKDCQISPRRPAQKSVFLRCCRLHHHTLSKSKFSRKLKCKLSAKWMLKNKSLKLITGCLLLDPNSSDGVRESSTEKVRWEFQFSMPLKFERKKGWL